MIEDNPLVSICCLSYNHERYIRQCLEGFVMQETNFPIEVWVHDDASTDSSAEIIREYAAQYPFIKPIFQVENQYCKGGGILAKFVFPKCRGKYIALCEGDDYWTDPYKLQKQVDYMEANLDCSICFHSCQTLNELSGKMEGEMVRDVVSNTGTMDLIKGNYIHTLSAMYRVYEDLRPELDGIGNVGIGDYPLWLVLSKRGYIHKIHETMGVYRYGNGVWAKSDPINQDLAIYALLNRIRTLLDSDGQRAVDEQINILKQKISFAYIENRERFEKISSSKAYKIGKHMTRLLSIFREQHKE